MRNAGTNCHSSLLCAAQTSSSAGAGTHTDSAGRLQAGGGGGGGGYGCVPQAPSPPRSAINGADTEVRWIPPLPVLLQLLPVHNDDHWRYYICCWHWSSCFFCCCCRLYSYFCHCRYCRYW